MFLAFGASSVLGAAIPILYVMLGEFSLVYFLFFFVTGLLNYIILGIFIFLPIVKLFNQLICQKWWFSAGVWSVLGVLNWWMVSATPALLDGMSLRDVFGIFLSSITYKVILWPAGLMGVANGLVFWTIAHPWGSGRDLTIDRH